MQDDIKALIQNGRHCVLATAADNSPYCSLMAYATDNTCTRFFMVTHRNTRKHKNILGNPRVSLLIDSRDTSTPQALTIEGRGEEIVTEPERKTAAEKLLTDHPALADFISHPEAVFIRVTAGNAVFLNGLTDARYEKLV